MSRMGIGETLYAASVAKTKAEKIEVLQKNQTPTFALYLKYVFDPNVKFLLPTGDIKYKPNLTAVQENGANFFLQQLRRIYIFVENGGSLHMLDDEQRKNLFVKMLESVEPLDAEAAIAMKDKKLPFKLSRKLIEDAFPGFLPPDSFRAEAKEDVE